MHAGVGPTAGHHADKLAGDFRERLLQRILQRPLPQLKLPPGKIGAVVRKRQFERASHGQELTTEPRRARKQSKTAETRRREEFIKKVPLCVSATPRFQILFFSVSSVSPW